jgi:hypothetical protein
MEAETQHIRISLYCTATQGNSARPAQAPDLKVAYHLDINPQGGDSPRQQPAVGQKEEGPGWRQAFLPATR